LVMDIVGFLERIKYKEQRTVEGIIGK